MTNDSLRHEEDLQAENEGLKRQLAQLRALQSTGDRVGAAGDHGGDHDVSTEGGPYVKGDVTAQQDFVGGDKTIEGDVYVVNKDGNLTVVHSSDQPDGFDPDGFDPDGFDPDDAESRYLHYLISNHRYLQLQGIRSGGKLVHIELDQIYIRLRATQRRLIDDEERWLRAQADLAPGEGRRRNFADYTR